MQIPSILIIENEWQIKKQLSLLLISNDYEVIPVSSLFRAQRVLRTISPQLILCSEHLPDGDATDFITQLRSSKEFSDLPLVVLKDSTQTDSKKYTKQGATDTLHISNSNDYILKVIKKQIDIHLPGLHSSSDGITGQLHKLSITDLIYELAQRHSSGKITIDAPEEMVIYLKKGKIIYSKHGITIGKKALFRCLRIADAAYYFQRNMTDIEPNIDNIELDQLIREATTSNQQLMVNFHKFPSKYSRIKILSQGFFNSTNLEPKIKAATEIIRRYPLVYQFIDHLNLPDIACYELLNHLKNMKVIDFVEKLRNTTILVDNSCDLSPLDFTKHKISVLPLNLKSRETVIPNRSIHSKNFYHYQSKDWEQSEIVPFTSIGFKQCFSTLNIEYEILTIAPASEVIPTAATLAPMMKEIKEQGIDGMVLQEYETNVYHSSTFSIGYGLLTIQASLLALEHQPVELLIERLKRLEERMQLLWIENQNTESFLGTNKQRILYKWNGTEKEKIRKINKDEIVFDVFQEEINRRLDSKSNLNIAVGCPHTTETVKLKNAMKEKFIYATVYGFDITPVNMKIAGSQIQMMAFVQD